MINVTPHIKLSNGHEFSWMVASGALWFDGKGWPFPMIERELSALRLIDTRLFTIVLKTITKEPRVGNLKRWSPWTCIQPIKGGWVNKVGLTNGGIGWWEREIAHTIDWHNMSLVASIQGDTVEEAVHLARRFNNYPFKAYKVNLSCPNTGHPNADAQKAVDIIDAVQDASMVPVGSKLGTGQPYLRIARELSRRKSCEFIALNTVPWEKYSDGRSPLWRLQESLKTEASPNGGGGGGVSGRAARDFNWKAVGELANDPDVTIPIVGPGVWEYNDIERLMMLGAKAVSFGSIHILRPCAPTNYVNRWRKRMHTYPQEVIQPYKLEKPPVEIIPATNHTQH